MDGDMSGLNTLQRFPSSSQAEETTDKLYGQIRHAPKQSNIKVEENHYSDTKSIKTRFSSVGRGQVISFNVDPDIRAYQNPRISRNDLFNFGTSGQSKGKNKEEYNTNPRQKDEKYIYIE